MVMKAEIKLDEIQVREIITQFMKKNNIDISHQDITFDVKETTHGDQRDVWTTHEFKGVIIKNVQLGGG